MVLVAALLAFVVRVAWVYGVENSVRCSHASSKAMLGRPSLLTGKMRRRIQERWQAGDKVNDLARKYGVHRSTIYRVLAERYGRRG